MPSKTPNGNKPAKNGIRKDTEMKDASKSKGKKGAKDGEDDKMTVVVPPSKGKKAPAARAADADGDVSMGDDDAGEQIDPAEQTVTGKHYHPSSSFLSAHVATSP